MPSMPCPSCGYDLTGLPAGNHCPECGLPDAENRYFEFFNATIPLRPLLRSAIVSITVLGAILAIGAFAYTNHLGILSSYGVHLLLILAAIPTLCIFAAKWFKIMDRMGSPAKPLLATDTWGILGVIVFLHYFIFRLFVNFVNAANRNPQIPHTMSDRELLLLGAETAFMVSFLILTARRARLIARTFRLHPFSKYHTDAMIAGAAVGIAFTLAHLAPAIILFTAAASLYYLYHHLYLSEAQSTPAQPTPPPHPETPPPQDRRTPHPPSAPRA